MPRKPTIRWSKGDKQIIDNLVKSVNNKIDRVVDNFPEIRQNLPSKINRSTFLNLDTRQGFNREVNRYKRFLKSGAETPVTTEKGVKTTKWEIKELQYDVNTINRSRTKERKIANVSTQTGTMGTIESRNLQPKKFNINKYTPKGFKRQKEGILKQSSPNYRYDVFDQYKANYLKAIDNLKSLGVHTDILKNLISQIDAEELYYLGYDEDGVLIIDFIYEPQEVVDILTTSIEYYTNYLYDVDII